LRPSSSSLPPGKGADLHREPGEERADGRRDRRRLAPRLLAGAPVPEGLGWIAEGAAISGRDPKEVDVAPFLGTSVHDDIETAKSVARWPIGFYIGGMGKFYSQMLTRAGFGPEVERVKKLYDEGKRDEAYAAVDDKLIEATSAVGTMDAVRAKLDVFRAAGVTTGGLHPMGADEKTVSCLIRDRGLGRATWTAGQRPRAAPRPGDRR
jgi:alkanesulfonate monooxygenase SsuD/methylene tetrahydromethanopterin reductase-like flavin-dependent oxidoreductase (luciferase family)